MKGFTLMELVVVVAIMAVSLTAAVGLFTQSFRSGGKTERIVLVEENMRQSIDVMERMIRNASKVESVGGDVCPGTGTSLTILNRDNGTTTFSLSDSQIASNGAALSGDKVVVESLQFQCVRNSGAPDKIEIDVQARADTEEEGDTVTYERNVDLRNY